MNRRDAHAVRSGSAASTRLAEAEGSDGLVFAEDIEPLSVVQERARCATIVRRDGRLGRRAVARVEGHRPSRSRRAAPRRLDAVLAVRPRLVVVNRRGGCSRSRIRAL